jgi:small multidrug resistance family-3 protein
VEGIELSTLQQSPSPGTDTGELPRSQALGPCTTTSDSRDRGAPGAVRAARRVRRAAWGNGSAATPKPRPRPTQRQYRGPVARSIALFLFAALCEISGAWPVWQGVREHKGWIWVGAGAIALGLYGFIATLQPEAHFGRILAAYGGIFVAGSIAWGMIADGYRPGPLRHHRRAALPRRDGRHYVRTARALTARRAYIRRSSAPR